MGFSSRISSLRSLFKWSQFLGHVALVSGITWAKLMSLVSGVAWAKLMSLVSGITWAKLRSLASGVTWVGLVSLLIISISLQGCQETAKAKGRERPAPQEEVPSELTWLLTAYPDHLSHSKGNYLVWKDSTRMVYSEGEAQRNDSLLLESPMLADIFWWHYRTDTLLVKEDEDPGRLRPTEFFAKMYGETKAKVTENLTVIRWLPSSTNLPLKVTKVNGVADSLQAISDELDQLPELRKYLDHPAGTFNYRKIAGTERLSAHSWGIAIDINVNYADYWRWSSEFKADRPLRYRNRIPMQIVRVFEKHGFIWGGRWHHYDTMHFEYRPEFFVTGYKEFLEKVHTDR